MDVSRRTKTLLLTFALALTLTACGTRPGKPITVQQPPSAAAEAEAAADAALAAGDPAGAAARLERAADTAGERRASLLLRAAELRLQARQPDRAAALLARLPVEALSAEERYRWELAQIRILHDSGQNEVALTRLGRLPAPPAALLGDWLRLRALVLATDRPLLAAQARADLEPLLTDPAELTDNRHQLWALLEQVPLEDLRELMPPPPDLFGGWLELAFLSRTQRLNGALADAIHAWQQRYPAHPASAEIVPELLNRSAQAEPRQYQKIAVLLPLTGPLAAPAQAILEGIRAAHDLTEGEKPEVSILDIGPDDGQRVSSAYQQAVHEGAELVIGPLTKEALIALTAATPSLTVPVLALNTLPEGQFVPPGLYQFGLTPEDEAVAAADYALARGYQRILILTPEGDWGARVRAAFAARLESGGGTVLETASYDPRATDFSEPIRALLNLDASDRRYRQLRAALRNDIRFEPYRRGDIDAIFIGAFPREARLIQPQLRFFRALNVPVVATSHVYSGTPNPTSDHDLDGIEFVDMPWSLTQAVEPSPEPGPDDTTADTTEEPAPPQAQFPRLYAFGMDAYRLVGYLEAMRQHVGESIDGVSGVLSLDAQGRIRRQLQAARFVGGRPQPVVNVGGPFGPGPADAIAPR